MQTVNLVLLPFRLLWDLVIVVAAIGLTIAWIGFVVGSVIGVVLLLIFMGVEGFIFPMVFLGLLVSPWPSE